MVQRFSFGKISICRLQLALSEPPRFTNGADIGAACSTASSTRPSR